VIALSELVAPRFRALVLLAAFTGLRWGELLGRPMLRSRPEYGNGQDPAKVLRTPSGRRVAGPPKSEAGLRVVALPAMLIDAMKRHLAEFPAEDEGLVFSGLLGDRLRRNNFHRSVRWSQSVVQAGLPAGFHFHDLRHTGNNLAAASGRQHPLADAPHGPRHHACCTDLPARDGRAGSRDRGCVAVPDRT
jgi:integrase